MTSLLLLAVASANADSAIVHDAAAEYRNAKQTCFCLSSLELYLSLTKSSLLLVSTTGLQGRGYDLCLLCIQVDDDAMSMGTIASGSRCASQVQQYLTLMTCIPA